MTNEIPSEPTGFLDIDQLGFNSEFDALLEKWSTGANWLKYDLLSHYLREKGYYLSDINKQQWMINNDYKN